ncbi:MAG: phytoene/squalene synthase family protein [Spirochaetales bacterium]|nr:phytoene/squalene synthase family protein [Spirochaetales bacterium]
MSVDRVHYQTFKSGSKTYFNSSLFFPRAVREEVFVLYGFVRVADNFVDAVPQDAEGFRGFRDAYEQALAGRPSGDPIIDAFVELAGRRGFDPEWTRAFLYSMELDLTKRSYDTLEETLEYIYGSAEVIGLYMARLLDLDPASHPYAQLLGRSMQYINFIRDIDEDRGLGRRYLPLAGTPLADASKAGTPAASLEPQYLKAHPLEFAEFLRHHLDCYRQWQREAEKGFRFIPRRFRIPIKTASDMYNWTARRIEADPMIVFERKVKPSRARILLSILGNAVSG